VVKGKLSFIKELAGGLLPTHSEQEIRDHEAWYQEYLQLNDKKKEVIQRWREKKEVTLSAAAASIIIVIIKFLSFLNGIILHCAVYSSPHLLNRV